MTQKTYTALFLFSGLGGGALGFLQAAARIFGQRAAFRSLGGIDNDPAACADFEYLTKSPALCADIARLTPGALRGFAGPLAPDAAFGSAPCKSFSGLTNAVLAASSTYVEMARLYVVGVELLLSTWDVPPRLIILENVPRLLSKGRHLVDEVTAMLTAAGYAVHVSSHDCGELGGLAQHRRRALLVARLKRRVPGLLYQPQRQRVRACGEVLGELPMPETPTMGPMHRMPRIAWLTWVRLALIPAGGDHRDLPGVLDDLQRRREAWGRNHVERFDAPSIGVAGDGSNGAYGVADPRVCVPGEYANGHTVAAWEGAARTVTSTGSRPIAGGPSVADPRVGVVADGRFSGAFAVHGWDETTGTVVAHPSAGGSPHVAAPRFLPQEGNPDAHWNKYRVGAWSAPAGSVIGATRPGSGAPSVADPRAAPWFRGALGVVRWQDSSGTVTGGGRPSKGPFTVADVRMGRGYPHALGVLPWARPSFTVAGQANPGTGAYTVADPRVLDDATPLGCQPRSGAYGVIPWQEAAKTITAAGQIDNGPFAVADPRAPETPPVAIIDNPKRSPFVVVDGKRVSVPVVILAEDGTWHRPMTPLELARLQDLPAEVDGAPLRLHGMDRGAWVERIGNAVPVGTARAIAEQMLLTLLSSDVGAGLLPSGGAVWVQPGFEAAVEIGGAP